MTVPVSPQAGDDDTRRMLAEVLANWKAAPTEPNAWDVQFGEDAADALTPVVERIADQRAADAIRQVAIDWKRLATGAEPVARYLRARANALTDRSEPA